MHKKKNKKEKIEEHEYLTELKQKIKEIDLESKEEQDNNLDKEVKDYLWFNELKLVYKSKLESILDKSIKKLSADSPSQIKAPHKNSNKDFIHQPFTHIYTCHEGLLLNYEGAHTVLNKSNNKYYNLSAELLWIGERTNNINEAHIEYFRGIANPVGIKVSCRTKIEDLLNIMKLLNPENEEGKILIISRVGNSVKGKAHLEALFPRIKQEGLNCLFICDPMHGNTEMVGGFKSRKINNLLEEINFTIKLLKENGLTLNGLHFESTPFDVTECIYENSDEISAEKYLTQCDPRLNLNQITEIISNIDSSL